MDNGVYHKLGEEEEKKDEDDQQPKKKDGLDNSSNDSLLTSFNKDTSLKSDDEDLLGMKEKKKN